MFADKISMDIDKARRLLGDASAMSPCSGKPLAEVRAFLEAQLASISEHLVLIDLSVSPGVGIKAHWRHTAGGLRSHYTQMLPIAHWVQR